MISYLLDIRKVFRIGVLLGLSLSLLAVTAFAYTVYPDPNYPCWTVSVQCPGETYSPYGYCSTSYPYYCPSAWSYEVAEGVSVTSGNVALSTNVSYPAFAPVSSSIIVNADSWGAYDPYQYTVWIHYYDLVNNVWLPWSVWTSWTTYDSFSWQLPQQPGFYAMQVNVRSNYVNWADASSPIYYFATYDSAQIDSDYSISPPYAQIENQPVQFYAQGAGAPLNDYLYKFGLQTCSGGNLISDQTLFETSYPAYSWTYTWTAPLYVAGRTYGLYAQVGTSSKKQAYGGIFKWDVQFGGGCNYDVISSVPLSITTSTLPNSTVYVPYYKQLEAEGGFPPYSWVLAGDIALLPGITLSSDGILSGTPIGWYGNGSATVSFKVSDSQAPPATFTKSILWTSYPPLNVTTSSLPNGSIGGTYNQTLSATGGNGSYRWTLTSGSLPTGLTLSTSGIISGSLNTAGTYTFTVMVSDTQTAVVTASRQFTITVYAQLRDTSAQGSYPTLGVPYNFQLSAAGGKAPYYWTITSDSLPTGLTLNQSTGLISGTPTAVGSYNCSITTTDSQSPSASIVTGWSFPVSYPPVQIPTASMSAGAVGISYNQTLTASGGNGNYSWSLYSGSLPPGLTLSSTGVISGSPTTNLNSPYNFTVKVTDNQGSPATATKPLTISILPGLVITPTSFATGTAGTDYSKTLSATGGNGSYVWSVSSGSLPDGLALNSSTGVISGISADVGNFNFSIQVTDTLNSPPVSSSFTLIITNSPVQNSQNSSVIGCEATPLVCTNSTTDVISGIVAHDQELFTTKGSMQNIAISLFYRSLPAYSGSLGNGWSHNYDIFLTVYADGSILLQNGSGEKHYYTKNGSNYDSTAGDTSVLTTVSGGYKITYRDGSSYNFNSTGKITSIADRFGNAISFEYTNGDLTKITDPAYRVAILTYDQTVTPHRISSIISPEAITYPDTINNSDSTYIFSYSGNNLYRVTNPAATYGAERGYWEYQYYPDELLKTKRDPNGNTSQYSYYADKRMQTATDPNGRTRTIDYPAATGTLRTSTLTEKDGGQWLYTYDSSTGAIKQKTDPNGKTTDFYYYTSGASNGFIKAKTEPKDGAIRITTFYSYDSYGNLLIETEPADLNSYSPAIYPDAVNDITTLTSKTPPIKAARHSIYDNAAGHYDRITSIADERGATTLTTSFAYSSDAYGEVVTATSTPGNYVTITRKKADGTIRQLTDANGKTTSFYYQSNLPARQADGIVGLPASINAPDGTWTIFDSNDKKGNPLYTSILNPTYTSRLGIRTTYDKLGRLTDLIKYPNTPADSFESQYSYDLVGNLTSGIDGELNETKYQYNYNRQVTKITDAKLNDTIFKYSGSEGNGIDQLVGVFDANVSKNTPLESQPHTAYQYDQLGRLDTETDPLGKKIHYTYYDNGQLKEKYDVTGSTPGTLLVTFYYNNRGQITDKTFTDGTYEHYTYTANGQLETVGNQNIVYTFAYYTDGRLQSITDNSTPTNRKITYDQYDALGQRKQVTILKDAGTDQRIITYDYDTANRPWHITSTAGTFTYAYDNMGRRQTVTYPNQLTANYVFDDLNRLTSLTHKNGATPFATFNYTQFDKVNNRKAVTGSKNEIYGYDENYRLTSVTATKSEAFTYDAAGNRLTGPGASDTTYQSNAANQMTQGRKLTYDYDNRGNQTTKTVPGAADKTWTRTWDYNNRLIQEQRVKGTEVRTVTYKYDPFGRRIEKKFQQTKGGVTETETSNYLYDNEDIAVEYFTTTGETEKTFVIHGHGIDEPLAIERGGSYYYYHQDALGSITHITNAAKAVVQSYTYDAYGMATPTTGFRNSYQYAGYIWDWETGTYHVRERTYDPMAGIWTSKDPIGMAGGDTNLYRYVEGQPINFVDPSGLSRIDPGGLLERPFAGGGGISAGTGNLAARSGGASISSGSVSKCTQPYTRSSLKLGQEMHKAYRSDNVIPNVAIKEYKLPSGKRVDFIDFSKKTIFELKPNNPRSVASGNKQLEKYLLEVESNYGNGWSTVLELY